MPELRWTLLILGAVFIIALAIWELRRQRQSTRPNATPGVGTAPTLSTERIAPTLDSADAVWTPREPTISFPELQPEPSLEVRGTTRAREPAHDPPVVEIDSESFDRLQAEGEAVRREAAGMEPEFQEVFADTAPSAITAAPGPMRATREFSARDPGEPVAEHFEAAPEPEPAVHIDWQAEAGSQAPWRADSHPETDGQAARHAVAGRRDEPRFQVDSRAEPQLGTGSQQAAPDGASHDASAELPALPEVPLPTAPRVEWPPEEVRKIVALRLVSPPGVRFQGRAVRQALAGEGFVLGKFDIFHLAGPDGRALLSAASLTKPGTFNLNSMDGQRFGGLSLFAVLPGPLSPTKTYDELLAVARRLNDRLQGALQDERGEPLTPIRSAAIRQSLVEGSSTGTPAASHAPDADAAPSEAAGSGAQSAEGADSAGTRGAEASVTPDPEALEIRP
jgi:cell division protein ZipA